MEQGSRLNAPWFCTTLRETLVASRSSIPGPAVLGDPSPSLMAAQSVGMVDQSPSRGYVIVSPLDTSAASPYNTATPHDNHHMQGQAAFVCVQPLQCHAESPGETGDQSTLTRQTFLSVPQSNLAMFRHRSCAHDRIEQWPIE